MVRGGFYLEICENLLVLYYTGSNLYRWNLLSWVHCVFTKDVFDCCDFCSVHYIASFASGLMEVYKYSNIWEQNVDKCCMEFFDKLINLLYEVKY